MVSYIQISNTGTNGHKSYDEYMYEKYHTAVLKFIRDAHTEQLSQ